MRNTRSSVPSLAMRRVTPSASMIQSPPRGRAEGISRTEPATSIDRAWLNPASGALLWVDIANPSVPESLLLSDTFGFHPLSVEDAPGKVLATFKNVSFEFLGKDERDKPVWVRDWKLGRGIPVAVQIHIDDDTILIRTVNR